MRVDAKRVTPSSLRGPAVCSPAQRKIAVTVRVFRDRPRLQRRRQWCVWAGVPILPSMLRVPTLVLALVPLTTAASGCGDDGGGGDDAAATAGGPTTTASPSSGDGATDPTGGPATDGGPGDGTGEPTTGGPPTTTTDAATDGDSGDGPPASTGGDGGTMGGGTIDVTLSGCSIDFGGTVVVSYNGSLGVASIYDMGATLSGSFQFDLQSTGTMMLSSQHRVDTGNIINMVDVGAGTWTNLDSDSFAGGTDSISGTLTVNTYNPSVGEADIDFSGVTLMNVVDGSVCTIDGSIVTTQLYP